jgi:lysine 6-dehydrogenase
MRAMKNVVVLGCGLVGSLMIRDLALSSDLRVRAVDVSEGNLDRLREVSGVELLRADLSSPDAIRSAIAGADVVVGAVPGRMGFAMLRTVIEEGISISDISFSPEDPLVLDGLAKSKGVTAVVDCGVSPGLSNLAIGRAASKLVSVDEAVIYVGGLPAERFWPFEYRSVFSPTDVIEEYTRPARFVENGRVVVREALSEVEPLDFKGVGTLEAFNTDGLRTVMHTVKGTNMKEKTLRYPGHVDRMRMLREMGLFSDTPVEIDGLSVVPRRLTEKLMFEKWRRPLDEEELTVLRVMVSGSDASGATRRYTYDLLDRTDPKTGATSMARTTGFPCVIMARLLASGEFAAPGIQPPELFGGNEKVYEIMMAELRKRGVAFRESVV